MSPAEINAIGAMLASLRNVDEHTVAVSFAAHTGSAETREGSISATVTAGGHSATSKGLNLNSALCLARGKLRREADARAKKGAQDEGVAA